MSEKRKPSRRWTEDEDALLREAIAKYDCRDLDWQEIASHVKGRTNKDCRKRWVYTLSVVTKGPWGQDEDQRLKAGVELHRCRWNKVSEVVGTRQADQCSRRWHECLNPNINRGRWSLLEDYILENAVRIYGRNWTEIIERFFPDRTPIATRNRYKQRFEKGSEFSSSVNQDQHSQMRAMEEEGLSHLTSNYKDDDQPSPSSLSGVSAYGQLPDCYSSHGIGVGGANIMSSVWGSDPSPAFPPLESFPAFSPTDSYQNTTSVPNGSTYQSPTTYTVHGRSRNDPTFDPVPAFSFKENLHPLNQLSALDLEEAFRQLCESNTAQQPQQQSNDAIIGNAVNIPPSSNNSTSSTRPATPQSVEASSRHHSISSSGLSTTLTVPLPLNSISLPDFSPSNPPSLANLFSTYNSSAGTALPLEKFLDQIIRQLALYRAQMTGVQALDFETTF